MDIDWQNTFKGVDEELSEKHGFTPEQVRDMVDVAFTEIYKNITHWTAPRVQITNFGTFRPVPKNVDKTIRVQIRHYRKGRIDRDTACKRIRRLWMIRNRLKDEAAGKITYNEWKKLKQKAFSDV